MKVEKELKSLLNMNDNSRRRESCEIENLGTYGKTEGERREGERKEE